MKRLIVMVLFAGAVCACGEPPKVNKEVRSVMVTIPEVINPVSIKNYPGIVREKNTVSIGFKTAGQIKKIYVQEGDYIHRGDMLAELDDTDYRLGVEALQIQYSCLEDEVSRVKRLFEKKSISANEYEKAVAGLEQLGVQLQANKNKLSYTKLYAPADGYIERVNFAQSEMVDAGTAIFTLLDISSMEVTADIPVDEFLKHGEFVRFFCRAAGIASEFPMRLLSLTPKADGNQLYQLRLSFDKRPDKLLTAGMNVTVGIVAAEEDSLQRCSVPLCAVFKDKSSGKACVWVLKEDSTVTKCPVILNGTDAAGHAVVIGGLTGNERIVRAGVNVLRDGEKVNVIGNPSKTNIGGLL